MFSNDRRSTIDAKSALILGHISTGMGERTLAQKYQRALQQAGCAVLPTIDIVEWMGESYEQLAKLNYDLADGGFDLFEEFSNSLSLTSSDVLLILSWNFSLAAFFATGLHKERLTAAALHVHHSNERILTKLYEPADLLITGSLLAHERAIHYGIAEKKLLYMPHVYPSECEKLEHSKKYVERLAESQGKKIGPHTKIVGCVGRFEYGKNCEFAVEAVRRLAQEKEDIVLVLKGDFPKNSLYPEYHERFSTMLQAYQHEPWLLWDNKSTPYPKAVEEYTAFDVLLHPSGAEVASQVAIECLGLQKPVVVLNCTTNPYLFKEIAYFVPTTNEVRPGHLPFYIPEITALCEVLRKNLKAPNREQVEKRFHERILKERIPILFERDPGTLKALYASDRKNYSLT